MANDGALAQLGERNTGSVEVSGSIPLGSTTPFDHRIGFARRALHQRGDRHRLDTHAHHLGEQRDAVLLIIGETVGVKLCADRRVARGFFLVLIKHPIDRAAVPKAVFPRLARDARQLGVFVDLDISRRRVALELGLGMRSLGVSLKALPLQGKGLGWGVYRRG